MGLYIIQGLNADRTRLTLDKREELYGRGDADFAYSEAQVAHVNCIVDGYTGEQSAAALAQANALFWEGDDWEPDHPDDDPYQRRLGQRLLQGRGL